MRTNRLSAWMAALLLVLGAFPLQAQSRRERLQEHVYYLAADSLRGRAGGSADATRAAQYIIAQYEQAGVRPLLREGWYDRFTVSQYPDRDFKNVVGLIEGTDPALRGEFIVIGAHYDHLGVRNDKVYNGADDNASGSAAVIEIARALTQQPLGRSVIIAAFDGEELGLLGSTHLAGKLDSLHYNVKLMMSVDMVGWLQAGKSLKMEGVATIHNGRQILTAQAGTLVLDLKRFERSIFTATDTEGFALRGIPTLAVTTGLKSPYHKPEDDADLIDYEGLDRVTGYLSDLTQDLATRPDLAASGKVASKHKSLSNYGVDFALGAGWTQDLVQFPDASFNGKAGTGWAAGVEMQASMGHLGLRTQALYKHFNARYPLASDPYRAGVKLRMEQLCVPVNLVIQTPRSQSAGAFFIGGGGYYAYNFCGKSSPTGTIDALPASGWEITAPAKHQAGLCYTYGVRLGAFQLDFLRLFQLGLLSPGGDAPKARSASSMVQLKYIF